MNPEPRINLSDSSRLAVRGISLVILRLDATTLAPALAVATEEFGKLTFPLTITDVRVLGETCTRAANATPEQMAAMMQLFTEENGE